MKRAVFQTQIEGRLPSPTRDGNPIELFHSRERVDHEEKTVHDLILHASHPDQVLEFNDAHYVPGNDCLYDATGRRIDESCVRRGPGLSEIVDAPCEWLPLPSDFTTISEPTLYLGSYPYHWGHFVTEGISRIWPYLSDKNFTGVPGFYCKATFLPQIEEFFSCFDLAVGASLVANVSRPVKLKKCFIPKASFSNRAEAYGIHFDVFGHVTDRILQKIPAQSDAPIYLSRTKINKGHLRNISKEDIFENMLYERGVRICHPETMTLSEQILVFNSHSDIIGTWGSAFHGIPFRRTDFPCSTHMAVDRFPNTNYLMFDAFGVHRAIYIDCMTLDPSKPQVWPKLYADLDVDIFGEYLASQLWGPT